ncbi:MAG: aminoacyl-tRNA hydrolase [Desulfocapsaceae bacterium]
MKSDAYTIVGLGNPGTKYLHTRHNVGFIFVDWLAEIHGASFSNDKHQGLSSRISLSGVRVDLLKPQTFMNRSGRSVASFIRYFGVHPSRMLVIHDDIDMHPGRVKLVEGGGTGGHNGIRSIVAELGTNEFFRLKIGVGRPGAGGTHPNMDVDKYVLADFSAGELEEIRQTFAEIEDGLSFFLKDDVAKAMTRLNAIK